MQQYLCYNTGSQLLINVQGQQQYDDKMDKGKKYNKNTSCGHSEPENCRRAPPPPYTPPTLLFQNHFYQISVEYGLPPPPARNGQGGGEAISLKTRSQKPLSNVFLLLCDRLLSSPDGFYWKIPVSRLHIKDFPDFTKQIYKIFYICQEARLFTQPILIVFPTQKLFGKNLSIETRTREDTLRKNVLVSIWIRTRNTNFEPEPLTGCI